MKKYLLLPASMVLIASMGAYAQTTNYVSKFNSSGTAVNSSMVDNGSSVTIGNTVPLTINSGSGILFPASMPKVELWTGSNAGNYTELMTIRHQPINNSPVLRQLGMIFKMSDESNATESNKMGGMLLESNSDYANFPSLNFVTFNKRQMTIDHNGRVGIGTTTPLNRLTVTGVTNSIPQNTWLGGSNTIAAFFGENGTGNGDMIYGFADNVTSQARPVLLARRSRGTLASPAAVVQSDYLGSFLGSGYDGTSFFNPGEIAFVVDGPVSTNVIPTSIIFGTNGGSGRFERMRVASSGNIGIGTKNPQLPLSIVSAAPTSAGFFRAATDGIIAINGALGQTVFGIYNTTNSTEINGAMIRAVATQNWSAGTAQGAGLAFHTTLNNNTVLAEVMRIDNNGFVGIGTSTPREALSVNGNIRAKQMKVELANFPDYVFKPTYDLRPLSEVKNYIDKYSHLPDVPSAAEVEKDGMNVGEMNAALLKKIEELTLYLLEQNRRIESLEKKLAEKQ